MSVIGMLEVDSDTDGERERYDKRAKIAFIETGERTTCGFHDFPDYLQAPYLRYYEYLHAIVNNQSVVIELGAGDGQHSLEVAKLTKQFVATDISPASLELLKVRLAEQGAEAETKVADMAQLPFVDASVDVIICAGSLSYADPIKVDDEIVRVLKPGGYFICVDSLNHNPIYRMNRYVHFLRGHRTKSTLKRMPTLRRIEQIGNRFSEVDVQYFGSITFSAPVMQKLLGNKLTSKISRFFDQNSLFNRMAFKFVLCAQNPVKTD